MDVNEKTWLLEKYKEGTSSLPDTNVSLPPLQPGNPGFAIESILNGGLQVPSKCEYVTSGFAYPSILANCGVSKNQWNQFTQEVMQEAKLSYRQWTTIIGKGLGVLAIGGVMVGFLSAFPAIIVIRKARRNREEQNLITAAGTSELSRTVDFWNATFFQQRGILIRVDLPSDVLADLDVSTGQTFRDLHKSTGLSASAAAVQSTSERLRACDNDSARAEASYRARIVIIPISKQFSEAAPLSGADPRLESVSSMSTHATKYNK